MKAYEIFHTTEAISALSETLNESGEIELVFTKQGSFNFTKEQDINLYRIIQELVTNTLKHADAKKIGIQMIGENEALTLIYRDDGVGIDLSKIDKKKGIGLKNIESRLSLISGKMNYQNQSSGFHIEIQITPSIV